MLVYAGPTVAVAVEDDRLSLAEIFLLTCHEPSCADRMREHREVAVLLNMLVGGFAGEHAEPVLPFPSLPERLVVGSRLDEAGGVVEQEGGVGVEVREVRRGVASGERGDKRLGEG